MLCAALARPSPQGMLPACHARQQLTRDAVQYWKIAIEKTEAASREVSTAQLSARAATKALGEAQQLETQIKEEASTVERLLSEAEGQRAKIPVPKNLTDDLGKAESDLSNSQDQAAKHRK